MSINETMLESMGHQQHPQEIVVHSKKICETRDTLICIFDYIFWDVILRNIELHKKQCNITNYFFRCACFKAANWSCAHGWGLWWWFACCGVTPSNATLKDSYVCDTADSRQAGAHPSIHTCSNSSETPARNWGNKTKIEHYVRDLLTNILPCMDMYTPSSSHHMHIGKDWNEIGE